jgi:ABC-type multidrug transport system fused ATPase/permease subunit
MERAMGKLNESIGLATSVRSLSAEPTQRQAFDGKIAEWLTGRTQEYRVQWRSNIYRGTINSVGLILPVIIVCYGAVKGQYTAGDVYLILSFTQIYLSSLSPISRLISDTGDVDTAAERIMEILDEQPTVVDSPNAVVLESIETLEFQNVSFLYPGTKRPILDDISFKLNERKTIALVGPSGAGKSTIIKLILRFYEPSSGQILINDQPIETFTQASVRLHLGVVMQDVALFNDTAAENLRLARPNATMKELQTAASIAHADIFIEKLPDKYKSIVGERGIKLSGGEKQRMAIARAILRDPDLIILDEATSALDSESERFVQEGLQRLMEGKAALVIAHRLSTIRRADMILVLKDGQIVERGDHTKLANKKSGLYARLYELQTAGAIS